MQYSQNVKNKLALLLSNKRAGMASLHQKDQDQIKNDQFITALTLFQLTKTYNVEQLKEILPAMRNILFFEQSCPPSMTLDNFILLCVQSLAYEMIPKQQAVFHCGDFGDKFYIIMDGIAAVYVQKGKEQASQELYRREQMWEQLRYKQQELPLFHEVQFMKEISMFNLLQQKCVSHDLIKNELLLAKLNKPKTYFNRSGLCLYQDVASISQGRYFGEMALTNNQPRGASIIAITDLHVVTLKKADFRVIFEKQIQDSDERLEFFSDQFKIGRYNVSLISQYFTEQKILPNIHIWKENDPLKGFFLIKSGWIQLEIQIEEKQKHKLDQPKHIVNYPKKQRVILSTQTNGFVGEQEVINKVQKYPHSCLALETTIIYWISCERFKIMRTLFPEVLESLKPKTVSVKLKRKEQLFVHQQELHESLYEFHNRKKFDRKEVKDLDQQIQEEFDEQHESQLTRFYVNDDNQIRSHFKKRQSLCEIIDFNEKQQKVQKENSMIKNDLDCVQLLYPNMRKKVDLLVQKQFCKYAKKYTKLVIFRVAIPVQNLSIEKRNKSQEEAYIVLSRSQEQLQSTINQDDLPPLPQPQLYRKNYLIQNKIRTSQAYLKGMQSRTLEKYQKQYESSLNPLQIFEPEQNLDDPNCSPLELSNPFYRSSRQRLFSQSVPVSPQQEKSTLIKLKKIIKPPSWKPQSQKIIPQHNFILPQYQLSPSKSLIHRKSQQQM